MPALARFASEAREKLRRKREEIAKQLREGVEVEEGATTARRQSHRAALRRMVGDGAKNLETLQARQGLGGCQVIAVLRAAKERSARDGAMVLVAYRHSAGRTVIAWRFKSTSSSSRSTLTVAYHCSTSWRR